VSRRERFLDYEYTKALDPKTAALCTLTAALTAGCRL